LHLHHITCGWRSRRRRRARTGCRSRWRNHSWRNCNRRRWRSRRWLCCRSRRRNGSFRRNHDDRRRPISRRHRSWRNQSRRWRRRWRSRSNSSGRGFSCRPGRRCFRCCRRCRHRSLSLRFHARRRHRRFRYGTRRWLFGNCLLLRDGAQHVSRTRNMRKVDLGLEVFFGMSRSRRRLCRTGRGIRAAAQMLPHQICFEIF
jgi:hypothetical protein